MTGKPLSADDRMRRKIIQLSATAGGVVATAAFVPIVASIVVRKLYPAAGERVDVDPSRLAPGQMITVDWLGKPVWILHRNAEMIESLARTRELVVDPDSERSSQPEYCRNNQRSIRPELFVAIGLCTHLGCVPLPRFKAGADEGMSAGWPGGFLCPCHSSHFDLAGRAFRNREAKDNLIVPPHRLLGATLLRIGEDHTEA